MVPEFTQISHDGVTESTFNVSEIETARASNSGPTSVANSGSTTATAATTTRSSLTSRRHHYPALFPLLTMVRYFSTSYVADIVTEEFTSASLQHACVSYY